MTTFPITMARRARGRDRKGYRSTADLPPIVSRVAQFLAIAHDCPPHPTQTVQGDSMAENVYKVIELIGTSTDSWEKAASAALKRAQKTLRDLRVAEVK